MAWQQQPATGQRQAPADGVSGDGALDGVEVGAPLGTVYLKSAVCGGTPEALSGLSAGHDVQFLREMVSKLPLTIRAWHEDPTAEAEPNATKKEVVIKPGDEVPVNQILLLGQGIDLEVQDAMQPRMLNEADGPGEEGQPPGELVHLRDGRKLHEYGLAAGSVPYVVVEGPRPTA